MRTKLAAFLAFGLAAVLPGCMVVPLAEPAPAYSLPARAVVVHPRRPYHRHHWRGPRYGY